MEDKKIEETSENIEEVSNDLETSENIEKTSEVVAEDTSILEEAPVVEITEVKVEEKKEEVCNCHNGGVCTCGDDCKCGDNCNCGVGCKCKKSKKKIIIFVIIGVILLIGIILSIYFFIGKDEKTDDKKNNDNPTIEKEDTKINLNDLTIDSEKVKDLFIAFSEIDADEYDSKNHMLDGWYDVNRSRNLDDINERKSIVWEVLARNNKVSKKKCSELEKQVIDETYYCLGYDLSDLDNDKKNKNAKTDVIEVKVFKEKYLELFGQDAKFTEGDFELYNYVYGYAYYDKTSNVYAVFQGISGGEAIGGSQTLDKIEVEGNVLKLHTTLVLDETYTYPIVYTFKAEEKTGNLIFVSKVKTDNNTYEEEEEEEVSENCKNYNHNPKTVKVHGLDGEFRSEYLSIIKEYTDDNLTGTISFSYNLDSDSKVETFTITSSDDEIYKITYVDIDNDGNEKVYSPVIKEVNGGLTGVSVIDIDKNDGRLDILLNFYLDVSGEVILFNVTTGETFSFGAGNTNMYIDGNGKILAPLYFTSVFDVLLATEYYEVGSNGLTKHNLDLSNINKEVMLPCGEPDFTYCTSPDCDGEEYKDFIEGSMIKMISYSEKDGLLVEYNKERVYLFAPWG